MTSPTGAINQTKVMLWAETSTDVFELIGGQLSHNHSQSRSVVNITNKSLGEARILLSGAGAVDNNLSGDTLFSSDSIYQFMKAAFTTGSFVNILIKYDTSPLVPALKIPYLITNIGESAGQGSAFTTNLSMQGVNVSVNGDPPPNVPPTANFSFVNDVFVTTFTDLSSDPDGFLTNWSWDFDDTFTSTLQNPVHDFGGAGTFNVTLTVTDNDGAQDNITIPVVVSAANVPPTASFTHVTSGLEVTFTDTSTDPDGTVTAWSWDFGD